MTMTEAQTTRTTSGAPIDIEAFAKAGGTLVLDERSSGATSTLAEPSAWLRTALGAVPTASGQAVTEEHAMRLTAVYACVRVLAEGVSMLPLKLYRRNGRARERVTDHPLANVLHRRANPLMTAMQLREVTMVHLALWGNAFWEKQLDGAGRVVALWPIPPRCVRVEKGSDKTRPTKTYRVAGVSRPFTEDEIVHIAGLGFDGYVGKSPIQLMRESLGIAIAAQKYGAKFFANDARPGIYVKHPQQLSDTAYDRLKRDFADGHQGVEKAWKVKILEEGMDVAQVGLPPGDAQFIETRKFEARDVAAIYRVPPHMVGDLERATFSNIEHQGLEFVMHTLGPWLVRIEQEIEANLLEDEPDLFVKHSVDALLRGDVKSRNEAYAVGRNWGWLSVNDIRESEDMNPVDGGDIYLQPLNMVEAGTDPFAASDEDLSARFLPAGGETRRAIERRALPDRYRTAKALETTFRAALKKIVARELREIRGAVDEHLVGDEPDAGAFGDWLVTFAGEHETWTEGRMRGAFQAMADAMVEAAGAELDEDVTGDEIDTFVRQYSEAFARRHAGSMRGQLLGLVAEAEAGTEADAVEERLVEWEDGRAETTARRERQRSSNAMTRAVWAVLGVATLTWRSVGKSCPICDEMDGRTSRIGGSFATDGDTVADLDVSGRVSHPPIHDGCDCIMMPGTGARSRPTAAEVRDLWGGMLEAASPSAEGPEPRTYAQRRNAWIRRRYQQEISVRYGQRGAIIEELRAGMFEGEPYELAPSTCRKICDGTNY